MRGFTNKLCKLPKHSGIKMFNPIYSKLYEVSYTHSPLRTYYVNQTLASRLRYHYELQTPIYCQASLTKRFLSFVIPYDMSYTGSEGLQIVGAVTSYPPSSFPYPLNISYSN